MPCSSGRLLGESLGLPIGVPTCWAMTNTLDSWLPACTVMVPLMLTGIGRVTSIPVTDEPSTLTPVQAVPQGEMLPIAPELKQPQPYSEPL